MVMSIKSRRRLLIAAELVLAAGICVAAWWAFGASPDVGGCGNNGNPKTHVSNAGTNAKKMQSAGWYTQVMNTQLRKPLYDPKPEPKKVVKKVEKPLRLQLLGTIIEGSKSSAIIKTSRGDTKFAKVGDTIEEAELIEISSEKVLFNFDGRQVELKRPTDGAQR